MHMSKSEWKGVQAHVHDRNLSATNSDVATRPAHVESKDKKGTKERKGPEASSIADEWQRAVRSRSRGEGVRHDEFQPEAA